MDSAGFVLVDKDTIFEEVKYCLVIFDALRIVNLYNFIEAEIELSKSSKSWLSDKKELSFEEALEKNKIRQKYRVSNATWVKIRYKETTDKLESILDQKGSDVKEIYLDIGIASTIYSKRFPSKFNEIPKEHALAISKVLICRNIVI